MISDLYSSGPLASESQRNGTSYQREILSCFR